MCESYFTAVYSKERTTRNTLISIFFKWHILFGPVSHIYVSIAKNIFHTLALTLHTPHAHPSPPHPLTPGHCYLAFRMSHPLHGGGCDEDRHGNRLPKQLSTHVHVGHIAQQPRPQAVPAQDMHRGSVHACMCTHATTRAHRWKARALSRSVCSSSAPDEKFPHAFSSSTRAACASKSDSACIVDEKAEHAAQLRGQGVLNT